MTGVVVTGLGALCAGGVGVDALWRTCASGGANVVRISHFDTRGSVGDSAGIVPVATPAPGSPERLRFLAREAIAGAVSDAGIGATAGLGLVLATTDSEACGSVTQWRRWRERGEWSADPGLGGVATELGFDGPVLSVGTASAAGGCALYTGAALIESGLADQVVVCGADTVTETAFWGLASLRALSRHGCRPFNRDRSGIMVSEAAAALVLEDAAVAGRRHAPAYARQLGAGICNRAAQPARPEAAAVVGAIEAALASAGAVPSAVDYINAHAAGTRHGDRVEIDALEKLFGAALAGIPIVSSKAALGHCQGAAGTIEAVVSVLTIHRGEVLGTRGVTHPEPQWDHLHFGAVPDAEPPRTALTISCGLGGATAAVLYGRDDG